MEGYINRYFKHKYQDHIVISTIKEWENTVYGIIPHLFVESVDNKEIIGLSGLRQIALTHDFERENWELVLNQWAQNNLYEDYNPFLMTQEEADTFISNCQNLIELNKIYKLRLGQVILNHLGYKAPSPNGKIFNSNDENMVLNWFYKHYVKNS